MPYERTRKIEERFEKAAHLIKRKRLSANELASELAVSLPTAQRIVAELKRRGYSIRSVHEEHRWHYEISTKRHSPRRVSANESKEKS